MISWLHKWIAHSWFLWDGCAKSDGFSPKGSKDHFQWQTFISDFADGLSLKLQVVGEETNKQGTQTTWIQTWFADFFVPPNLTLQKTNKITKTQKRLQTRPGSIPLLQSRQKKNKFFRQLKTQTDNRKWVFNGLKLQNPKWILSAKPHMRWQKPFWIAMAIISFWINESSGNNLQRAATAQFRKHFHWLAVYHILTTKGDLVSGLFHDLDVYVHFDDW